jgi:hypothetical protein
LAIGLAEPPQGSGGVVVDLAALPPCAVRIAGFGLADLGDEFFGAGGVEGPSSTDDRFGIAGFGPAARDRGDEPASLEDRSGEPRKVREMVRSDTADSYVRGPMHPFRRRMSS